MSEMREKFSQWLGANSQHVDSVTEQFMFEAWQAATEAAKATGTAGELPPEWITEVCGPDVDGLSYGQGYRRGFNDCRKKVSELQAKLITDEEAWEIIKDEARMQVIDEHGSMAIVIKSPSEAWFIARAILAADNRPSMITAEDCPICKGQSGGIGADGVENDCHECFRREVQAARQPAPVAIKTWQERAKGKVLPEIRRFITDAVWAEQNYMEMLAEIADLRSALAANVKAPFEQTDEHKAFMATYLDAARKASDNTSAEMILWHANRHWNGKAGEMWRARAALAATNRSQPAPGMVSIPADKLTYSDCKRFGISVETVGASLPGSQP